MLLAASVPGCGRQGGDMAARVGAGAKRVLLDVPAGYRIVNETDALLFLDSDHIRVKFFRMDEREFQIRKNSCSQMASDMPRTQFGDIVVPAAHFKTGGTAGWKFAILEKNTKKARTVEYLLTVTGGHVRATFDRDDYQPFDEAPIERLLATVTVGTGEPLGGVYHEFFGRKGEYDLTTGPARLRIFADNYQFLAYDFESNPFEPFPEMNEQTSQQGWTRNQHALWIFTRAHGNDHRIDVRLAVRHDPDHAAMRQTVHNLRLPTGTLALFEHPDHVKFTVPPGDYMIYCRAYNLGAEESAMSDLPDDEFFKHDEWERYELILVPGMAEREGRL
jgi:hypothetical protein